MKIFEINTTHNNLHYTFFFGWIVVFVNLENLVKCLPFTWNFRSHSLLRLLLTTLWLRKRNFLPTSSFGSFAYITQITVQYIVTNGCIYSSPRHNHIHSHFIFYQIINKLFRSNENNKVSSFVSIGFANCLRARSLSPSVLIFRHHLNLCRFLCLLFRHFSPLLFFTKLFMSIDIYCQSSSILVKPFKEVFVFDDEMSKKKQIINRNGHYIEIWRKRKTEIFT